VIAVEATVVEAVAVETELPAAPKDIDERAATPARSRRSRQRAAPVATSASSIAVESAARDVVNAATEPAPAPAAVDSAISERVETLEHGLRRVLAEVRNLRELLADPSADR
jgi:hypothetical protein